MTVERLYVFCEGQTEETFTEDVLRPHFLSRSGTNVIPLLIPNRVGSSGRQHKGGWVSYEKTRAFIDRIMRQHHNQATWFTTLLDLYALPNDFPSVEPSRMASALDRTHFLEQAFARDIEAMEFWRFTPHLQRHEFEALLLAEPEKITGAFPQSVPGVQDLIADIRGLSPEDIDDGPETSPSKRIIRWTAPLL